MEKCSKCKNEAGHLIKYTDLNEKWGLCYFCNNAFDQKLYLLKEFMKEDFGCFPVEKITKDMILARIKRAEGKSPWKNHCKNVK